MGFTDAETGYFNQKEMKKRTLRLILIVALTAVVVSGIFRQCDKMAYEAEIESYNDSIVKLNNDIEWAELRLQESKEVADSAILERNQYQDSLSATKKDIRVIKYRYEKRIANLRVIPTDSLYINGTEWLDSLSVLWGTSPDSGSGEN